MFAVWDYQEIAKDAKTQHHHLFLRWLLINGVIAFLVVIAADLGYLQKLYASDRSYISILITFLYIATNIHCAWRVFHVSGQLDTTRQVWNILRREGACPLARRDKMVTTADGGKLPSSLLTSLIGEILDQERVSDSKHGAVLERDNLIKAYGDKLRAQNEFGWFIADILLKLGLLGTVIGFIIMLGSVADITSFDANIMQQVLGSMSAGMGVALFTTLAGLVGGMLLAVQYQLLDNGSDNLIALITKVIEVNVSPLLTRQTEVI